MANWLLKEEPTHYSFTDLLRDGRTRWDGVHNPLALRHLRQMSPKDRAIFYHTGSERACVGLLEVTGRPRPAREDPRSSWWVEVRAVRALARPIPLAELRNDPALAGLDLFRLPRLSVVPLSDDRWARLLAHESATPWVPPRATAGPTGPGRGNDRPRRRTAGRRVR